MLVTQLTSSDNHGPLTIDIIKSLIFRSYYQFLRGYVELLKNLFEVKVSTFFIETPHFPISIIVEIERVCRLQQCLCLHSAHHLLAQYKQPVFDALMVHC